jgi:hypothetical protein
MLTVILVAGICVMLIAHCVWLTVFLLDVFFETEPSTAAERARSLWGHLRYGIVIELTLVVLIGALVYNSRGMLPWAS